jgi:hypothetical protein
MLPSVGPFTGLGPMKIDPPPVALTGSPLCIEVGAMALLTTIALPPVPPKATRAPLTLSKLSPPVTRTNGPLKTLILLPLRSRRRSPVTTSVLPFARLMSGPFRTLISPRSSATTEPVLTTLLLNRSMVELPVEREVSFVVEPRRLRTGLVASSSA